MKCKEVIEKIERLFPTTYALEWDNVGLLAGRMDKEVKTVYIALDATEEVIAAAVREGTDLLITHHPLIFSPLKQVTDLDVTGRRLITLIQNDISYYAMHTNYDVLGMAELSGHILELEHPEVLEVTAVSESGITEGIGRVADIAGSISLKELCEYVKERFRLEHVIVFGELDAPVSRIAVSPGSGKSMVTAAVRQKADVLITGDMDHHDGIDAVAKGIAVIDAGHYGTEYMFIEDMGRRMEKLAPELTICTAPVSQPFQIV